MEQPQNYLNLHDEYIREAIRGDQAAYKNLYELYSKAMYNIAYRITNDEDDAADVLQEAFISAFKNLKNYRADASFGAWLKRIVVNRSINHIRKNKFERLPDNDLQGLEDKLNDQTSTSEQMNDDELIRDIDIIKSAVQDLPDGYRIIFSLYLLEGYDHQEIADIMDISVSTSKSQYNRAKKKLRELVSDKLLSNN